MEMSGSLQPLPYLVILLLALASKPALADNSLIVDSRGVRFSSKPCPSTSDQWNAWKISFRQLINSEPGFSFLGLMDEAAAFAAKCQQAGPSSETSLNNRCFSKYREWRSATRDGVETPMGKIPGKRTASNAEIRKMIQGPMYEYPASAFDPE